MWEQQIKIIQFFFLNFNAYAAMNQATTEILFDTFLLSKLLS
jgi:hypothetical protein